MYKTMSACVYTYICVCICLDTHVNDMHRYTYKCKVHAPGMLASRITSDHCTNKITVFYEIEYFDICIYVYMYICIYVYMYICIYVYMTFLKHI